MPKLKESMAVKRSRGTTKLEQAAKGCRGSSKTDEELKAQVVDLHLNQGVTMSELARRFSVDYRTVRRWVVEEAGDKPITLQSKIAADGIDIRGLELTKDNRLSLAGQIAPQDMTAWINLGETFGEGLGIESWQAKEITKAIALGIPERLAVGKGGVSTSDFDNWIKLSNKGIQPYRDWITFLQIAQVAAISDLVATVREGRSHTWQGAAWLLARLRPEYFHKDVIRDQHNNALGEMDDEILQKVAREWITGIDEDAEKNKLDPIVVNIDDLNLD